MYSPNGVDRFYNLVKSGYFKDVVFFRVIAGFMAQFGIHGDPKVSAKWRDANIQDDPVKGSNVRGAICFAKSGAPNSRSTQFFISFGNNTRLDKDGFSAFGKVVEGMDVVDKLNSEYGEGAPQGRGPDQQRVQMEGNAYLKKEFPNLDSIKSATIVE
jgi:peptidyl-prolyl cis-trans isomerase A (cyclophilin A)